MTREKGIRYITFLKYGKKDLTSVITNKASLTVVHQLVPLFVIFKIFTLHLFVNNKKNVNSLVISAITKLSQYKKYD